MGVDEPCNTIQVNFIDYNKDGLYDIFYANHPRDLGNNNVLRVKLTKAGNYELRNKAENPLEGNKLYRNNGDGTFTNVAESVGLNTRGFSLSSIVTDFNKDGYQDLLIGNDYIDPDEFMINQNGKKFTNRVWDYFNSSTQNTMGTDFEDINNDGYMDYVALDMLAEHHVRNFQLFNNMKRDKYDRSITLGGGPQIVKNVLQMGLGDGKYSEAAFVSGIAATDWSWSPLFADFNNDGFKDLHITNGNRRDFSNLDFMNFRDQMMGKPITANNINEVLGIIPSIPISNKFYSNNGDGTFTDKTKKAKLNEKTFSNGSVYVDLDNDGDLDLITNNINSEISIYKNLARETYPDKTNFVKVKLRGPKGNSYGANTIVTLIADNNTYVQEYRPIKGYLGSVEPKVHFGLGTIDKIQKIICEWSDGKIEEFSAQVNSEIVAAYGKGTATTLPSNNIKAKYRVKKAGINFTHKASSFNDFKREPLLLYKYSDVGPALAKADVNGDGLEDVFLGGGTGQSGKIFLQNAGGGFKAGSFSSANKASKEVSAQFLDIDGDKDLDLYVVSGGGEFNIDDPKYQDLIYINNGNGNFKAGNKGETLNGSVVCANDFDQDGDLDLFVGSRAIPGRYPEIPKSSILINENGKLNNLEISKMAGLNKVGLVTDAQWSDLDGDNKSELIIIGEWMHPKIYSYNQNGFVDVSSKWNLDNSNSGLWNDLHITDIDGDGDNDLIAGNFGLNTRFKASKQYPLSCYAGDFDDNGFLDPILTQYEKDKNYPLVRKDVIESVLPKLKKKFLKNEDYAKATIYDLFDSPTLQKARVCTVSELASGIFINNGGSFEFVKLPKAFP